MKLSKNILLAVAALMLFTMPAFAQYSTFIVDDNGNPATTYPTLTAAIATASTFPGGPHKIIIEPGTYHDADLGGWTFDKIGSIVGDPDSAAADIKFISPAGVHNLVTLPNLTAGGVKFGHLTVKGYNAGVYLNGTLNGTVDGVWFEGNKYGVYADGGASGNTVSNCILHNSTSYAVQLQATTAGNSITDNCFVGNNGGGVQGYDDGVGNTWSGNFFSDQVFTMAGSAGSTDNTKSFKIRAITGASSYNYGDTISVDFIWDMPVCANLDSMKIFAFNFQVNYNPAKLQLVAGSDKQDTAFFGGAAPAIYPAPDDLTPGQIVFGAAGNLAAPHMFGGRMASARFKVIAANTADNITMTSIDVRDPANNPIPASSGDKFLTLVDNVAPVLDSFQVNNPAGDNTYSDGSPVGGNLKLMVKLFSHDNYDLNMYQWRSDSSGVFADWPPAVSGTTNAFGPYQYDFVWLGLGEGRHFAEFRVKDAAGLISNVVKYVYHIDYTAPAVPTVAISDNSGCSKAPTRYTNDSTIKVTITPGDATADSMMLSESGVTTRVKYQAVSTFALKPGTYAEPHTVWVRLYDKYNNMRDWTASGNTITYDGLAPTTVGPLTINGGALKTNSRNVTWTITDFGMGGYNGYFNISEDTVQMNSCTSPGWRGITPANLTPWPANFAITSAGNGLKKIYLAAADTAFNISKPKLLGSITLDTIPPAITSYSLDNGAGGSCTPTGNVRARFAFTGGDVAKLQYSFDGTAFSDWQSEVGKASPDSAFGSVPATPGWHVLWIRLVDDIGNISATPYPKDSVKFDNVAPTYSSLVCLDTGATATPDPVFPSVTNSKTFKIKMTGISTDLSKLEVSTDLGVTYTNITPLPTITAGAMDFLYTMGTPNPCSWYEVRVRLSDCAGNTVVASTGPNGIYFDLNKPYAVTATGPALTNVLANVLTVAASDTCGMYQIRVGDGSTAGVSWIGWTTTPTVILNATPQGNHTVYVDVSDYGGNIVTKTVVIRLDNVAPVAGNVHIKSANALAADGWTNSQSGNKVDVITMDPDVKSIWLQNISAPLSPTGWIDPRVLPISLADLVGGTNGQLDTVQYWFLDSATNQSGPFNATIRVQVSAPGAPAAAVGVPGGDKPGNPKHFTKLSWSKGPAANPGQKWRVRHNFQNEYPTYPSPNPPHPMSWIEGILTVDNYADTTYKFAGPHTDIYSFSIWTLGKNGMWSAEGAPNTQVVATNYILGDQIDPDPSNDGCVRFSTEFGLIGGSYSSAFGDPNFNNLLDVAPTIGSDPLGVPVPDAKVDFLDLVVLAINYGHFGCTGGLAPEQTDLPIVAQKPSPRSLEVTASAPSHLRSGDEVVVPLTITNYDGVRGYHVVLDYDHRNFDLVRVEQGNGFKGVSESFFFSNAKSNRIDVSGVVLGQDVRFTGEEICRVVLKAKQNAAMELKTVELSFRDDDNKTIDASMSMSKTSTLPVAFELSQNYPNPFNPTTSIDLSLPTASDYKLTVMNVLGQVVKTFEGHSEAGIVTITWDASTSGSGVYFYRVETGSYEATRKMVLIK